MDDLLNRLRMVVSTDNVDTNSILKSFERNPYRQMVHDVMLERKELLRSKLNVGTLFEQEEPSPEIEEILEQFTNPTFPIEEVNTEKDEEWQPLERKYLERVNRIKIEMEQKLDQVDKDMQTALANQNAVLVSHQAIRPVDDKDLGHARMCITRKFEQAKMNIRGDAATKILLLRRDLEQQGRKRRNFDKNTTDILQNWFHEHRSHPYPSDQEKAELAKQCNIKISQVNNWFGNQRIRTRHQAQKMLEEEERGRVQVESEAQMIAMDANPPLQAMVIPAQSSHASTLMINQQGFLSQNYFQGTEAQMQLPDNGSGQQQPQFYTDFDTFGLIHTDADHFGNMNYMG